jgi:hypothetical protein
LNEAAKFYKLSAEHDNSNGDNEDGILHAKESYERVMEKISAPPGQFSALVMDFAKFQQIRVLGEGASAIVRLLGDATKLFAVKCFHPGGDITSTMFLREAGILHELRFFTRILSFIET